MNDQRQDTTLDAVAECARLGVEVERLERELSSREFDRDAQVRCVHMQPVVEAAVAWWGHKRGGFDVLALQDEEDLMEAVVAYRKTDAQPEGA